MPRSLRDPAFHAPCRWAEGDIQAWSAVTYPDKLLDYVQREFKRLKARQAALMGINGPRAKL